MSGTPLRIQTVRDASAVGKALKHGYDQARPFPFYMEHDLHYSPNKKSPLSPTPRPTINQLLSAADGVWFCPYAALPLCSVPSAFALSQKDTLGIALQYGVIGVVWVLHCNGLGELAQHPLLEGFQPLIVVAPTHIFFVLQEGQA